MHIQEDHLFFSSRSRRVPRKMSERRHLIPCTHGCYMRADAFHPHLRPWEVGRRVAEARILAVSQRLCGARPPIFTGESALIIRGLETWWDNPDVSLRRLGYSSRPPALKAVRGNGFWVPEAKVVQLCGSPHYEDINYEVLRGLRIASPGVIAMDLCGSSHKLQCFYDVSMLVQALAGFDRFTFFRSQERIEAVRGQILGELAGYSGFRGVARARLFTAQVPVGFESPAEAVVAWALMAILPKGTRLVSQLPVQTATGEFFIDIALPDYGLAVEVSGVSKFGDHQRFRQRATKFLERQQRLLEAGWITVNVRADQTTNLAGLVRDLRLAFDAVNVRTKEPRREIWQPQTRELFHRHRRY